MPPDVSIKVAPFFAGEALSFMDAYCPGEHKLAPVFKNDVADL
jgi:hypothetical protein